MATKEKKYVPLDTSGNDYASMVGMSDLDKAAIEAAKQSYNAAKASGNKTAMDAAHQQAEAIRAQYGYSGGVDGSQYIPTARPEFSYEEAPSYTSRYQSQIDDLAAQIMNRPAFTYDVNEDPLYAQYRDMYTRSGQRAMQDTLGQVAARTGGLASSYATTASQQAYGDYMEALNAMIPELQQLAYSMYMDEENGLYNQMQMLTALEQGDYAKYQDLLGQYNADRSFEYGIWRDQISDDRYDQEWDYQVGRDQISDQRYEDETAWERSQYESETEYNRALERAQTLAAAGDFSGFKALGYTDAEIASLQAAYNREQAAASMSGSYSGGSGRNSSEGDGNTGGEDEGTDASGSIYQSMYDAGVRNEGDAYAWLLASGYNTTQAGKLAGYFTEWIDNGGGGGGSGETGYNESMFSSAMRSLATMMQQGRTESAISGIDSFWDKLSPAQKEQVQELLGRYGYSYEE